MIGMSATSVINDLEEGISVTIREAMLVECRWFVWKVNWSMGDVKRQMFQVCTYIGKNLTVACLLVWK